MKLFDRFFENSARKIAQTSSRRGLLKTIGGGLVGGALIPLLPVARAADGAPKHPQDAGDPSSCDYWALLCG